MHAQIASERLQMARQVPVDLTAAGERLAGPEGPRHPGKAVRPDDSPAGRQGPLQAAALGTVSGAAWKTIQQRDSVDVLRRAYDRVDGAAENDLLIVRGQESGRASGGVQGGSNPVIQISELPKVLERQVGTVVQAREVELEVKLHPEELGRVRISMSTGDGVLQVQVMAEREETLSLLRRHADLLGDALASGGFENVSFTFSEGDRNDEQRDSLWLAELEEKTVTSSATYSRGDRLDIRL
ncbi:flagellar hook-length control protein FliK [Tranquillimonas alkanivorans]|uniref:flagellar hook-length control protein FliK n=1 Tax=Tranquillimonas alkanivorans TaxID=441119 RepID=UPI0015A728AD|nr:flagellar hook-length control protein FliK [Tranquillimonas alkanivorans]